MDSVEIKSPRELMETTSVEGGSSDSPYKLFLLISMESLLLICLNLGVGLLHSSFSVCMLCI